MIDLIRQSAVPPQLLRSAAKGALSVPPAEMIEILVFLTKNPIFAEQARLTLAGWDESASLAVASDPNTPAEVLKYLVQNLRRSLFAALLENPAVPEFQLANHAKEATIEAAETILASARVRKSQLILEALASNSQLEDSQINKAKELLSSPETKLPAAGEGELLGDEEVSAYMTEHADEIAAEEGRPFNLIGGADELRLGDTVPSTQTATAPTAGGAAAAAKQALAPGEKEKVSTLLKVSRLNVGGRVQLAMKGNKDERFLLIRDGAKVVALAVLESPKVTDSEAEMFAKMKNVQDVVLRAMASKKKFLKNYSVIRNLIFNPKCPIDVSLDLMKHLMLSDLKNISGNKEVSDTVRKMGLRMFVQKNDTRKRD